MNLATSVQPTPDPLAYFGNVSSLLGLLVSLVGFVLTLWNVSKSRKAAEEARQSADNARSEIRRTDTMIDLAAAGTAMEEIKRLQRQSAWALLPDRYSALHTALTAIRSSRTLLSEEHKALLLGAIQQFRAIEHKIDRALASGKTDTDMPGLNKVVSQQMDKVTEILACLRMEHYGE